jgi:hypothetical protein
LDATPLHLFRNRLSPAFRKGTRDDVCLIHPAIDSVVTELFAEVRREGEAVSTVNSADRLYLVIESVRPDTKQARHPHLAA